MHDTVVVFESQPDWLTAASHGEASSRALLRVAERLHALEAEQGNRVKPFSSQGYLGSQCARVRLGVCARGTMVQLSGDLAALAWDQVYPVAEDVTRVDFAVTARVAPNVDDVALRHEAEYQVWKPKGRKKAECEYQRWGKGGSKFVIGVRTSDYYLRVYDKERESQQERYAGAWRYELECKAGTATRLALAYADTVDRAAFCHGLVHDYCSDHGLTPVFQPGSDRVLTPGLRRRSDATSRLAWYGGSVAPSLVLMRSWGYGDLALERLGLVRMDDGKWQWLDAGSPARSAKSS